MKNENPVLLRRLRCDSFCCGQICTERKGCTQSRLNWKAASGRNERNVSPGRSRARPALPGSHSTSAPKLQTKALQPSAPRKPQALGYIASTAFEGDTHWSFYHTLSGHITSSAPQLSAYTTPSSGKDTSTTAVATKHVSHHGIQPRQPRSSSICGLESAISCVQ